MLAHYGWFCFKILFNPVADKYRLNNGMNLLAKIIALITELKKKTSGTRF